MSHGSTLGHAHVAPWKRDEVARLAKIMLDHEVVGVARIGGIPGPQMAEMRESLRGSVQMVGAKNRLLKLAIQDAAQKKPGLAQLAERIDGQAALIATNDNPFKLYKTLRSGATMAPLKGGQVTPDDVAIKKGPTPFGPGPIVGELQKVGIPAKIEQGKVVITKDAVPVKAGERVSNELALMLAKLDIKPVELSILLQGAVEGDTLFLPAVLDVDEDAIRAQLMLAVRTAHELALEAAWPTKTTVPVLIGRAYRAARNLSLDTAWVTKDTAEAIIGRAHRIAVAAALEAGVDLGEGQSAAAAAYANILASIGKTEADLSPEIKERLKDHLGAFSGAAAAPAASSAKADEAPAEEEEPEVSEEEAAAGLGALFG